MVLLFEDLRRIEGSEFDCRYLCVRYFGRRRKFRDWDLVFGSTDIKRAAVFGECWDWI
jgi:hypothetical protein